MQAIKPDDTALVARAREGDPDAFEQLVRLHTRAVYGHALRFFGNPDPAEDVVQEVFIKMFRSIGTFDGASALSTWLYRITRNTCLDMVRAGKHRAQPIDLTGVSLAGPGSVADDVTLSVSVESAMGSLAPEDRDALSAVTLYGLSYAEAADAIGVPVGTVKSRVFRARRTILNLLDLEGGGTR